MEGTSQTRIPPRRPARLFAALVWLGLLVSLSLVVAGPAGASNASLKKTLGTWSQRIGADASGIGLSAARRHPRRMTRRAQHFRADALRARRALAAQRPSSARGRRARALALAAFGNYAIVGRDWALSGTARLHKKDALAGRYARLAQRFAVKGNRLLVSAGKLL